MMIKITSGRTQSAGGSSRSFDMLLLIFIASTPDHHGANGHGRNTPSLCPASTNLFGSLDWLK